MTVPLPDAPLGATAGPLRFPIPDRPAAGLAFALDLARLVAGSRSWIAVHEAGAARSEVEEVGRLVLSLAHGADGAARADGTAIGAAGLPDLGPLAPGPIVLVSSDPAHSGALEAWHRTCWEAGFALDLADGAALAATAEDSEKAPRIVLVCGADRDSAGARALGFDERALEEFAARGGQVLVDAFGGESDPAFLDSGFVVDRISRATAEGRAEARRPLPPAARPGPLLENVAEPLKRAMDLLADPAPAPRALSERALALVAEPPRDADASRTPGSDGGARPSGSAEVIAALPGGAPAITRTRVGEGAIWRVATRLDAATRRGMLGLLAAHARVRPVRADLPDGVEARERDGALLLVSHADRARELSGVVGRDLLAGARATGHVVLGARSAMVVVDEGDSRATTA